MEQTIGGHAWKQLVFRSIMISTGVASTIGGITTALIVKKAKVAYAILIGFILLFLAVLDYCLFRIPPYFLSDRNISYDISFFLGWRENYRSYL